MGVPHKTTMTDATYVDLLELRQQQKPTTKEEHVAFAAAVVIARDAKLCTASSPEERLRLQHAARVLSHYGMCMVYLQLYCNNYYDAMGLSATPDDMAVRKAYHRLSRQLHPDRRCPLLAEDPTVQLWLDDAKRQATEDFQMVGTAYENIKTAEARRLYNPYVTENNDHDGDLSADAVFEQVFAHFFGASGIFQREADESDGAGWDTVSGESIGSETTDEEEYAAAAAASPPKQQRGKPAPPVSTRYRPKGNAAQNPPAPAKSTRPVRRLHVPDSDDDENDAPARPSPPRRRRATLASSSDSDSSVGHRHPVSRSTRHHDTSTEEEEDNNEKPVRVNIRRAPKVGAVQLDNSNQDNSAVGDNSAVSNNSEVNDNSAVGDNSEVNDNSAVSDNSEVNDNSEVGDEDNDASQPAAKRAFRGRRGRHARKARREARRATKTAEQFVLRAADMYARESVREAAAEHVGQRRDSGSSVTAVVVVERKITVRLDVMYKGGQVYVTLPNQGGVAAPRSIRVRLPPCTAPGGFFRLRLPPLNKEQRPRVLVVVAAIPEPLVDNTRGVVFKLGANGTNIDSQQRVNAVQMAVGQGLVTVWLPDGSHMDVVLSGPMSAAQILTVPGKGLRRVLEGKHVRAGDLCVRLDPCYPKHLLPKDRLRIQDAVRRTHPRVLSDTEAELMVRRYLELGRPVSPVMDF
jgi:curved DNA-binding protein CbpA